MVVVVVVLVVVVVPVPPPVPVRKTATPYFVWYADGKLDLVVTTGMYWKLSAALPLLFVTKTGTVPAGYVSGPVPTDMMHVAHIFRCVGALPRKT